jgi:hypothetical protein
VSSRGEFQTWFFRIRFEMILRAICSSLNVLSLALGTLLLRSMIDCGFRFFIDCGALITNVIESLN